MVKHSRGSRVGALRHLAAVGAALVVGLLANVGPSLESPWREVAAGLVALGLAYGVNPAARTAPAEDDEAI